jgi:hypothetical protein
MTWKRLSVHATEIPERESNGDAELPLQPQLQPIRETP